MSPKLFNPFNLPAEWTEEKPWDIINCARCNQAWMVPAHIYEVWIGFGIGCPYCNEVELK